MWPFPGIARLLAAHWKWPRRGPALRIAAPRSGSSIFMWNVSSSIWTAGWSTRLEEVLRHINRVEQEGLKAVEDLHTHSDAYGVGSSALPPAATQPTVAVVPRGHHQGIQTRVRR